MCLLANVYNTFVITLDVEACEMEIVEYMRFTLKKIFTLVGDALKFFGTYINQYGGESTEINPCH